MPNILVFPTVSSNYIAVRWEGAFLIFTRYWEFLADLKSEVLWQHFASAFIPLRYGFQRGVLI